MLEAVLIDILRKKGILKDSEALSLLSIHDLYNKLRSVGEVEELNPGDVRILNELEKLAKRRISLADKLVDMRRLLLRIKSPILEDLVRETIERVKGVSDES